jgi:hypothetical protein
MEWGIDQSFSFFKAYFQLPLSCLLKPKLVHFLAFMCIDHIFSQSALKPLFIRLDRGFGGAGEED